MSAARDAAVGLAVAALTVGLAIGGCDDSGRRSGESIATALTAAEPAVAPFAGLTATTLQIGDENLRLVVADEESERRAGLRDRTDPAPFAGMVFAYTVETTTAFTMAGVTEPLDIGFYAADGTRVDGFAMAPCPERTDCPAYRSVAPFRFAVETPPGALPDGDLTVAG